MNVVLVALNASYTHTNLAIRQLEAYCKRRGLSPDVHICRYEAHINLPTERILGDIMRLKPDVVCCSCYIWNINIMLTVCERLKKLGCHILLGGPEVSFDAEEILEKHAFIDAVVCGEGERVFYGLCMSPLSKWRGVFKSDAPLPSREWPDTYMDDEAQGRIVYVETSRGCPYSCAFCLSGHHTISEMYYSDNSHNDNGHNDNGHNDNGHNDNGHNDNSHNDNGHNDNGHNDNSHNDNGHNDNSHEAISCKSGETQGAFVAALPEGEAVRRLLSMRKLKPRVIKLVDRTFNFNSKRARGIWKALIDYYKDRVVDTTYHFELSAGLLTDADFELLRQTPTGLFQFEIGVQSTNPDTLRAIKRREGFCGEVIRRLKESRIPVHLDLIAGLPHEDIRTFEKSFNDVYGLKPNRLQLGFLKLLKGSPLWQARFDIDSDIGMYMNKSAFCGGPPYEILYSPCMTFDTLCHLKDVEEVLDWYYNARRYPSAMDYLEEILVNPFEFYSALAAEYRLNGVFGALRSEPERAEFFFLFVEKSLEFAPGLCIDRFRELMRADLRLKDKKIVIPSCLR